MAERKTLNDYLFDQLHRLSSATEETIELEKDKAMHIISVSEQVLDAARLKVEIIKLGTQNLNQFSEIDKYDQKAIAESTDPEKKT